MSTQRERSAERGSGTVLALALILVLLILLAGAHAVTLVATSAAQAARGADLAALAAADAARGVSTGSPCAMAAEVASRNAVELTSCSIIGAHGTEALVRTSVPILPQRLNQGAGLDLSGLVSRGTARAGPPP